MELLRKIRSFISDPKLKIWWLKRRVGAVLLLYHRRRFGALVGYFVAAVSGWHPYNLYIRSLARRHGGTLQREVRGQTMELNLGDKGISRDLFLYGIREKRGTETFERELERIRDDIDDGVVLEIGANIGYFALMEHQALGGSAEVVAFEPDERNASLLERNLELNDYRDATTIERAAVGPETGTADFKLSSHTNRHRLQLDSVETRRHDTDNVTTVDMWSIDEYLAANDIAPESVVAVRMDIEGYEVEVLRDLERVLEADGPLVLSVEVHTGIRPPEDIRQVLDLLETHGFEVVEALTERITIDPFAGTKGVDDIASLPDTGPAYNVILRKDSPTESEYPHTVPVTTE